MKSLWRTLLILAAGIGIPVSAQETNESIEKLDAKWANALMANDIKSLEKIMGNELIYGHASGVLDTKNSFLDKLRSGKQIYKNLDRKNVMVKILDANNAITHSWMRAAGTNAKGPFDDNLMMLHIWTKRNGEWELVAHQTAKVEKLPD